MFTVCCCASLRSHLMLNPSASLNRSSPRSAVSLLSVLLRFPFRDSLMPLIPDSMYSLLVLEINPVGKNICCAHGSFSSARSSLPSFVYSNHCLQPFPLPCCQPCRNVVSYLPQFGLIDVGLVETKRGEGGEQTRPNVDSFSCIQNVSCSM